MRGSWVEMGTTELTLPLKWGTALYSSVTWELCLHAPSLDSFTLARRMAIGSLQDSMGKTSEESLFFSKFSNKKKLTAAKSEGCKWQISIEISLEVSAFW